MKFPRPTYCPHGEDGGVFAGQFDPEPIKTNCTPVFTNNPDPSFRPGTSSFCFGKMDIQDMTVKTQRHVNDICRCAYVPDSNNGDMVFQQSFVNIRDLKIFIRSMIYVIRELSDSSWSLEDVFGDIERFIDEA